VSSKLDALTLFFARLLRNWLPVLGYAEPPRIEERVGHQLHAIVPRLLRLEPPHYERGHTAGLRMLRVAAKIRAELGREHMGALYEGYGRAYWDQPKGSGMSRKLGTIAHIEEVLHAIGLPAAFATAVDDNRWDTELDAETALALSRTGRDVGTPIIAFAPPDGVSFFGPVISRIPRDEEAVPLWNAVLTLAQFPGFAEMKRSLREAPQLRILGHLPETPLYEDWQGGHRADALPEQQA
jgi:hypothetical protein